MNLLDNLTHILRPGLAILLIPFFFACNDPSDLGLELDRDDEKIAVRDTTLTLPSSTIYIDSLRTDQFSFTALGRYSDNTVGEIVATSNNSYSIGSGTFPSDTLIFEEAYILASIRSVRGPNQSSEQIIVHESSDTIFSQGIYLADRKLNKIGDPVADHTFSINADADSLVQVSLDSAFGEKLFTHLQKADSSSYYDSLIRGQIRLNPLIMEPGENNKLLFTLDLSDDTTGIYVKMKSPATNIVYSYRYDFSRSTRFTGVDRDKTGALLSDLQNNYDESTADTANSYIDMMAGVNTKIDLTPLTDLYEQQPHLIFNLVNLEMEVNPQSTLTLNKPIGALDYYFVTDNGTINATAVQSGQALNYVVMSESTYQGSGRNTLIVPYNEDNMMYASNITLFSQFLANSYNEQMDKYLTTELVALSAQRLTLGQTSFPKDGIKLKIYYSTLKDDK